MLAFSKLASAQAMCLSCRTKSLSPRDVLAVQLQPQEEVTSIPSCKNKNPQHCSKPRTSGSAEWFEKIRQ